MTAQSQCFADCDSGTFSLRLADGGGQIQYKNPQIDQAAAPPVMSSDSTTNNSNNTYNGSYTVGGTYNNVGRDQYNSNNTTTVHHTGPTSYYTNKKDVRTGDITSNISSSSHSLLLNPQFFPSGGSGGSASNGGVGGAGGNINIKF
jgi:flagellar hook assembly protein FlgD